MKYLRITIICILVLLMSTTVLPAVAAEKQAKNLTGKCSFDFGNYKSAAGRVLSDSSHYQIFQGGDSFSLTWEEPLDGARLCLTWQEAPKNVSILQYDADGTLLDTIEISSFYETATPLLKNARKAVVQAGPWCVLSGLRASPKTRLPSTARFTADMKTRQAMASIWKTRIHTFHPIITRMAFTRWI